MTQKLDANKIAMKERGVETTVQYTAKVPGTARASLQAKRLVGS